jgi:hypothetical protein
LVRTFAAPFGKFQPVASQRYLIALRPRQFREMVHVLYSSDSIFFERFYRPRETLRRAS